MATPVLITVVTWVSLTCMVVLRFNRARTLMVPLRSYAELFARPTMLCLETRFTPDSGTRFAQPLLDRVMAPLRVVLVL